MHRRKIGALGGLIAVVLTSALFASAQQNSRDAKPKPLFSKLVVVPARLAFGRTASRKEKFVIRNAGNAPLAIDSVSLSYSPAFVLTTSPQAGSTLAPRAAATTVVTFQPPADGPFAATITIVTDATRGKATQSVKLVGTGRRVVPTPTATPTATVTPTATSTPTPTSTQVPSPTATPTPFGPPPSISSLSPGSAVTGDAAFTLDITGQNFTPGSSINWNGMPLSTTYVSATEVTAQVPASDISTLGTSFVTVFSQGGLSSPSTFFVGSEGGPGYAYVAVNTPANDLAYDPVREVVYLSVPSAAPTAGNSISVLDLASATITNSALLGSEPDALAISDDNQYLYVGIDDEASVQRFTLPGLTPDITIPLGSNIFVGPYYALDLQVAPASPHTTAISLGILGVSPHAQGGIVIFDDATPRPTTTETGFGFGGGFFDSIQWGSDATAVYAADTETGGEDFYTLSVSSDGISLVNDYDGAFIGGENRIHFDPGTGLVYSDNGQIIDPSTGNTTGQFSGFGAMGAMAMVPDSSINAVFFARGGNLTSYDMTDLSMINGIGIPDIQGVPVRMIRWGNNGLALTTSQEGPVYLIGGSFVH